MANGHLSNWYWAGSAWVEIHNYNNSYSTAEDVCSGLTPF
jgi:hypothetical protein